MSIPYRVLCLDCGAWMHRNSQAAASRRVRCPLCLFTTEYPVEAFIEDKGIAPEATAAPVSRGRVVKSLRYGPTKEER